MTTTRKPLLTGGCQCGKVRYAVFAPPKNPHICHCRMCQKAVGGFFAAFASADHEDFAWTRGAPGIFKSSDAVERGFCRDCGTPLSFRYVVRNYIAFTLGSLDEPARVPPARQYGIESHLPFVGTLAGLAGERSDADIRTDIAGRLTSRQHPDRDP